MKVSNLFNFILVSNLVCFGVFGLVPYDNEFKMKEDKI